MEHKVGGEGSHDEAADEVLQAGLAAQTASNTAEASDNPGHTSELEVFAMSKSKGMLNVTRARRKRKNGNFYWVDLKPDNFVLVRLPLGQETGILSLFRALPKGKP